MIVTAAQLQQFHRSLGRRISGRLPEEVELREPQDQPWHKFSGGRRVRFYLSYSRRPYERAIRRRGGRQPVVLLAQKGYDGLWVGWSEEWLVQRPGFFELIGVGWTLFEGLVGVERKGQLVRAEWDQPTARGGGVAQPHWHFDLDVPTPAIGGASGGTAASDVASLELEELPALPVAYEGEVGSIEQGRSTSLAALHLPMGGWSAGGDYPTCWQSKLADARKGLRELEEWSEKVLCCLQGEMKRIGFGISTADG